MAHKSKMQELQHKYMENKIYRIDHSDNNYDNFARDEQKNIKKSIKTPDIHENYDDMMTLKVRNVPLPKQTKKKKVLSKNMNNMDNNFSFMPENKENKKEYQQNKQLSPQNYEKKFKRYLQHKNKSFFFLFFYKNNKFIEKALSLEALQAMALMKKHQKKAPL